MNRTNVTLVYSLYHTSCGKKAFRPRIWGKKITVIEACEKFKKAVKYRYIGFDNENYETCYFPLSIKKSTSYPGDYDEDFMGIEFCPFCGDKINIEVEEIFENITKSLLKHTNRKTTFLKGYNEIFLRIRLHDLDNRKKSGGLGSLLNKKKESNPTYFTYKYGLDKIFYIEEPKMDKNIESFRRVST